MAEATDVCTLTDVKLALGIDLADQSFDQELADKITSVSQMLDDKCGPIVIRTVTAEQVEPGRRSALGFYPVAAVTTATEWVATTSTVLTAWTPGSSAADAVRVELPTGLLRRYRSGSRSYWSAGTTLVVTYTAGRYATTALVDEKFARAAVLTVVEQWRASKGMGTATFGADSDMPGGAMTGVPRDAWVLIKRDIRQDWMDGVRA